MRFRWTPRRLLESAVRPPQVDGVLGINRRNVDLVYQLNRRRHLVFADDKVETKRILTRAGIPVPRTLAIARGFFEIAPIARHLSRRGDAVIKPARGKVGSGVMIIRPIDDTREDPAETTARIRRRMADILSGVHSGGENDVVLAEERLRPHPALADLWGHDIVDIRVIVHHGRPIMAMLRVPTSLSEGRSNLHAGALGLAIDLDTGLTGDGFWFGRRLSRHPDTGTPLAAIRLPEWRKILEISTASGRATPLGYIGVDIALDAAAGPVVLEINARPGLEIQNVNALGLREVLGRSVP